MRYYLGRGVMGPWPYIDISANDFVRIKTAKDNIFTLLGIEEKFDMLLQNYLEYEQTLLSLALGHMVSHSLTWDVFQDAIFLVNRRLSNLLTICRQYIDQVKHDFSTIYDGNAEVNAKVAISFSRQYDHLLGYRVMEALRNYTQHRAFPVTRLSYPTSWEDRKTGRFLNFRVRADLDVVNVLGDERFKVSVLKELKELGQDSVDLTRCAREYVQGLACAHSELRELTQRDTQPWEQIIFDTLQQYGDHISEVPHRVVAYRLSDAENVQEEVGVFRDGIDRLRELRKRRLPIHLSDWYVSNELP